MYLTGLQCVDSTRPENWGSDHEEDGIVSTTYFYPHTSPKSPKGEKRDPSPSTSDLTYSDFYLGRRPQTFQVGPGVLVVGKETSRRRTVVKG